jgi:hypothetical protein
MGRLIGNLLDSLPGTGPRTLLGALALVVGFTFWLQPESSAHQVRAFEESKAAEAVAAPAPAVAPREGDDDLEVEARAIEQDRKTANREKSVLP